MKRYNGKNKLIDVSSFVGMPVAGFEKEISSLLRNMEAGEGHGVEALRGEKEIFLVIPF